MEVIKGLSEAWKQTEEIFRVGGETVEGHEK
jgi:hypothetical protein